VNDFDRQLDTVVMGGGAVGSSAALAAAATGRNVLLLEANPQAAARFAGEWIHPAGAQVLDSLGLDRLRAVGARSGHGFVVFPDDGSEPIVLPYPDGQSAIACEHSLIVECLRDAARQSAQIRYVPHARVTGIAGNAVSYLHEGRERTVHAQRILGADGRSGMSRRLVGLPSKGAALSHMASVELRDVDLPFEGYGHVFLGGPGPILMYRIGDNLIRGCFDLPLSCSDAQRTTEYLRQAFVDVLPECLRQAFLDGLTHGPVPWAVNRFAARATYGRDPLWLVGDAVGHLHPLSAAGLSLGFLDAQRAASATNLAEYQRSREAESYVPELLANALYQVFTRRDSSATGIRQAMYRVWRQDANERRRTMRILMGTDTRSATFATSFVRMAVEALGHTTGSMLGERRLRELPGALATYREWVRWPAATLAPKLLRNRYRKHSTSEQPVAWSGKPPRGGLPELEVAAAVEGTPANGNTGPVRRTKNGSHPKHVAVAVPAVKPVHTDNGLRSSVPPSEPPPHRWGREQGGDWGYCKRALAEVSRTFSQPIGMLREELERAVTCGYLLCRIADSIEDHPAVPRELKDGMFAEYIAMLERGASPDPLIRSFEAIPGEDAELSVSRHVDQVMRVFGELPPRIQGIVARWCGEMARGMNLYTHREAGADGYVALHTTDDLSRYCYFVAGTVGHMLTELFSETLGDALSDEAHAALVRNAESFGSGLQMVNILKDVTDDRERRWSFIPREACAAVGLSIERLTDPGERRRAHGAVAPIFDLAEERLQSALIYALTIPAECVDIRMFCLLPLCMAAITLVHARGNDAMFTAGADVKVSRMDVARVIKNCTLYAGDDATLKSYYRSLWSAPAPEARVEAGA
jgi:phytoene/squalene synthetase/2-polyprenyl-6-methoxyphenol hydroxylase-like FAD-dependent oxidoreductase